MLIRSQNKEILSFLKNLGVLKKGEKCLRIVNYIGDNYITLAEYSTEEKALKVLDKIVEQYTELDTNKALATANMKYLYETDFELKRQYESCIKSLSVFQMPKDDEV